MPDSVILACPAFTAARKRPPTSARIPSGGWSADGAVVLRASAWLTGSSSCAWFSVNRACSACETGLACVHQAFSSGVLPGGMLGPAGRGMVVLTPPERVVVVVEEA